MEAGRSECPQCPPCSVACDLEFAREVPRVLCPNSVKTPSSPGLSYLTSLCLAFITWKMGLRRAFRSKILMRATGDTTGQVSVPYLALRARDLGVV